MWCPACRADVAAELSLDSRHFQCARCRTELGTAQGSLGTSRLPLLPTEAERNARDLLAKWNAQNLLESAAPRTAPELVPAKLPTIDAAIADLREAASNPKDTRAEMPVADLRASVEPRKPIHRPKRPAESLPIARQLQDETIRTSVSIQSAREGTWGATLGQMCAYGGIGFITCGTAVVLWSYFGGPSAYAPTGWLITTLGQMFLFLGIVTLISSGMEQTSSELTARIEQLGQRLMRMESLQRESLKGPHERRRKRRATQSSDELSASSV
ncbi:MAG: hypothetical protein U0872_04490 [Planctomycetaceae bacterium]